MISLITFKAFQGLEYFYIKFQDFPYFSNICTNPVTLLEFRVLLKTHLFSQGLFVPSDVASRELYKRTYLLTYLCPANNDNKPRLVRSTVSAEFGSPSHDGV